jgi:mannose-1-phosphate guanylyltransferase
MPVKNHNYVVILAGGSGTRLWPRSRENKPKQFLKLAGNKTMLQLTAERALKLAPWRQIIISTNHKHAAMIKQQLPQVKEENILLEPERKDTAPAMLVAAMFARSLDDEAIVINCASDHYVPPADLKEYARTMRQATELAKTHQYLLTVGISPTYPETGFGYIKVGAPFAASKGAPVFHVDNFTEKPNQPTAAAFIATGKYFWNANMYVWSARAIEAAFQKYAREIWHSAEVLSGKSPKQFATLMSKVYAKIEPISIDFAISEKANNLLLLPGNFSWTDVGDWRVAYDLATKDKNGNAVLDNTKLVVHESQKNYVSSEQGRLVTLVGVSDLIVVDTPNAILVVPKTKAQDVKKIVTQLKEKQQKQYL